LLPYVRFSLERSNIQNAKAKTYLDRTWIHCLESKIILRIDRNEANLGIRSCSHDDDVKESEDP